MISSRHLTGVLLLVRQKWESIKHNMRYAQAIILMEHTCATFLFFLLLTQMLHVFYTFGELEQKQINEWKQ
jgi:hypothetical protein